MIFTLLGVCQKVSLCVQSNYNGPLVITARIHLVMPLSLDLHISESQRLPGVFLRQNKAVLGCAEVVMCVLFVVGDM